MPSLHCLSSKFIIIYVLDTAHKSLEKEAAITNISGPATVPPTSAASLSQSSNLMSKSGFKFGSIKTSDTQSEPSQVTESSKKAQSEPSYDAASSKNEITSGFSFGGKSSTAGSSSATTAISFGTRSAASDVIASAPSPDAVFSFGSKNKTGATSDNDENSPKKVFSFGVTPKSKTSGQLEEASVLPGANSKENSSDVTSTTSINFNFGTKKLAEVDSSHLHANSSGSPTQSGIAEASVSANKNSSSSGFSFGGRKEDTHRSDSVTPPPQVPGFTAKKPPPSPNTSSERKVLAESGGKPVGIAFGGGNNSNHLKGSTPVKVFAFRSSNVDSSHKQDAPTTKSSFSFNKSLSSTNSHTATIPPTDYSQNGLSKNGNVGAVSLKSPPAGDGTKSEPNLGQSSSNQMFSSFGSTKNSSSGKLAAFGGNGGGSSSSSTFHASSFTSSGDNKTFIFGGGNKPTGGNSKTADLAAFGGKPNSSAVGRKNSMSGFEPKPSASSTPSSFTFGKGNTNSGGNSVPTFKFGSSSSTNGESSTNVPFGGAQSGGLSSGGSSGFTFGNTASGIPPQSSATSGLGLGLGSRKTGSKGRSGTNRSKLKVKK